MPKKCPKKCPKNSTKTIHTFFVGVSTTNIAETDPIWIVAFYNSRTGFNYNLEEKLKFIKELETVSERFSNMKNVGLVNASDDTINI